MSYRSLDVACSEDSERKVTRQLFQKKKNCCIACIAILVSVSWEVVLQEQCPQRLPISDMSFQIVHSEMKSPGPWGISRKV